MRFRFPVVTSIVFLGRLDVQPTWKALDSLPSCGIGSRDQPGSPLSEPGICNIVYSWWMFGAYTSYMAGTIRINKDTQYHRGDQQRYSGWPRTITKFTTLPRIINGAYPRKPYEARPEAELPSQFHDCELFICYSIALLCCNIPIATNPPLPFRRNHIMCTHSLWAMTGHDFPT